MVKAGLSLLCLLWSCNKTDRYKEWLRYGGNNENNHYSDLQAISKDNLDQLDLAWTYASGDASESTQIQVNPIVVEGILYGVSPMLKLFALNAATGEELWSFDPYESIAVTNRGKGYFALNVCRGVTFFEDGEGGRIFYAAGSHLFCIDASTGIPEGDFASQGMLDLHSDLGDQAQALYVAMTSPGIVYEDLIIIGSRVAEEAAAAPGHIRAYDTRTGQLRWIFHTIPQPGQPGFESWKDKRAWQYIGGANAWSGFSLDEENGIVYASLGSASPDFYGGKRKGDNLFANSILALDAATGEYRWHYQTVHHDVWDRDLPSAPVLLDYSKDGEKVKALAQITKTGFVFLLNRLSGEPLYPIEEAPVPTDTDLAGESLSPTQPIPTFPARFARHRFTPTDQDINPLVPESSRDSIRNVLQGLRSDHIFAPPSKQGTLIFPGYDGGGEWGGAAYNPETQTLFVNSSEMPWILTMREQAPAQQAATEETQGQAGKRLYQKYCIACHGVNREGAGSYPSLMGIESTYKKEGFLKLLNNGVRMMPAFSYLSTTEKEALASYLLDLWNQDEPFMDEASFRHPMWDTPYTSTGYKKFLSPEGLPALSPPWGTLNAIDLQSGELRWKRPLGSYPGNEGLDTGAENYGGPAITSNGLIFIAGTKDQKFRIFDQEDGALLREFTLPYAGFATPSIYEADGRQYVVIACGGGKLGAESGDVYMAFALAEQ